MKNSDSEYEDAELTTELLLPSPQSPSYDFEHAILTNDIAGLRWFCQQNPNYDVDETLSSPGISRGNALYHCLWNGNEEMTRLLLENGADPNRVSPDIYMDKFSPLHGAIIGNNKDCVKMLVQDFKANVDPITSSGETPLKIACRKGLTSMVKLLIDHGSNKNHQVLNSGLRKSYIRDTPLMIACRYGHVGTVKVLLSHGCDVNITNSTGNNALHVACATGNLRLFHILRKHYKSVDIPNKMGQTPLYLVIKQILVRGRKHEYVQFFRLARELVLCGAKMYRCSQKSHSPLMLLAENLHHLFKANIPCRDTFFWSRVVFLLDSGPFDSQVRQLLQQSLNKLLPLSGQEPLPWPQTLHQIRQKEWLLNSLLSQVLQPQSLKHLSLVAVCRHLHGDIRRKVKELPLPEIVKRSMVQLDHL